MGLSDCIQKINNNSSLPSFSEAEIAELESLRGDTDGVDPDVADIRAARAFGMKVNDSLNVIREAAGLEAVQISDEIVEPEAEMMKQAPQESDQEVEAELEENMNVPVKDIELQALSNFDVIAKNVQDQSIKLKRVQQQVEKETGQEVFGTDRDAYNALDLEKNIASAEGRKIINDAIQAPDSFVNRAREEGVSFNTDDKLNFGKYLHAKHAQERNARIKEIGDEKITALTEKIDKIYTRLEEGKLSGEQKISLKKQVDKLEDNLEQLGVNYEMAGSGMTDEEAQGILDSMSEEQKVSYSKYEDEFREKYISRLLGDREASGMIDEDLRKKLSVFENYVPLKVEEYESIKNSGSDVPRRQSQKGAKRGIKGIVGADNELTRVDPFVATLNELASIQGDIARNNVFQSFSKMMKETGANIDRVQIKSGIPVSTKDKYGLSQVKVELPKGFTPENSVRFYEDGKMKFMKINDKDLMNAITQTNQQAPGLYNNFFFRKFATFFRNVNTTLNPEFMFSNFMRDFQNAAISANLELKDMKLTQFMNEVRKIGGAMARRNAAEFSGKTTADTEYQKLIDDYEASGAKMSWSSLNNVDAIGDVLAGVEAEVKEGGITKTPIRVAKKIVQALELASDVAEHSSRVAAYKIARDKYRSEGDPNADKKAAILAKEVTVNFNRRGEMGNALNTLYIFMNAGIQGSVRTGEAFIRSGRVRFLAGTLFTLGFAEGYLNDAFGDDDDEYEQLDEFRKERYYTFKIPGKGIIQIPLPYGWSVFKYAGSKSYEVSKDPKKAAESTLDVLKSLLTNFSPISGASVGQLVAPTVIDPIVQASENVNFAGVPIYNEQGPVEEVRSQNQRQSTPEEFKKLAEALNDLTGGDLNSKGFIDYPPELYKHYVDAYGGGASRFAGRLISGAYTAYNGKAELSPDQIPLGRVFWREIPKRGDSQRVYEMWERSQVELFDEADQEKFYVSLEQAVNKKTIDIERAIRIQQSFDRNQFLKAAAKELGTTIDEVR